MAELKLVPKKKVPVLEVFDDGNFTIDGSMDKEGAKSLHQALVKIIMTIALERPPFDYK